MKITNRHLSMGMDHKNSTSQNLQPENQALSNLKERTNLSSKENSPRSEDDQYEVDSHVTRAKSVLRHGDFVLEETQVHTSNDSGLPEDKTSSSDSSKSSSVASSTSASFSHNGSPRTTTTDVTTSDNNKPLSTVNQRSDSSSKTSPAATAVTNAALRARNKSNAVKPPPIANSSVAATNLHTSGRSSSTNDTNKNNTTGTNRNKRNLSFCTVIRENTGFKLESKGCAGSNKRNGNQTNSSLRRSVDNDSENITEQAAKTTTVLPNSNNGSNRTSLSGHREAEKSAQVQSAKLRIVAKDNSSRNNNAQYSTASVANSMQSKLGVLEDIIETDTVNVRESLDLKTQAQNTKTIGNSSTTKGNEHENVSSSNSANRNKNTTVNVKTTPRGPISANTSSKRPPNVFQKTGAMTSSSSTKANANNANTTNTAKSSTASTVNSGTTKVIQVQEAQPSTSGINESTVNKEKTEPSVTTPTSSLQVSRTDNNDSNRIKSSNSSSSTVVNNTRNRNSTVTSNAVKTSANTYGRNRTVLPSNSEDISSHCTPQTNVKKPSNTSKTDFGISKEQTSNKNAPIIRSNLQGNVPRQGSNPSANPVTRQTSVPATSSQNLNTANKSKHGRSQSLTTKSTINAQSTKNISSYSTTCKTKDSITEDVSNKSNYTTTLRISLQTLGPNGGLDENGGVNTTGTIFNKGEAPVAPPRKKKGSASSRSSTDSTEVVVLNELVEDIDPIETANSPQTAEKYQNINSGRNTTVTDYSVHTLKHGMTPISSGLYSNMSKLPQQQQSVANDRNYQNVDHDGPQIIDPFESLNERRRKEFDEMIAREKEELAKKSQQAPRSGKGGRGNVKKPDGKPPKSERQGSATKTKRVRAKAVAGNDNTNDTQAKKRPKSSNKRKKKGKKKDEVEDNNLSENINNPNVALIGGIGWHIETGCNETTDVQAVTLKQDSESSDEEEINIEVGPDYLPVGQVTDRYGHPIDVNKLQRELTIRVSGTVPGRPADASSNSDYSIDSDFDDIPEIAEQVQNEVHFSVFGRNVESESAVQNEERPPTPKRRLSLLGQDKNKKQTMNYDTNEPVKAIPSQTQQAVSSFDERVSANDLNDMLAGCNAAPKLPNIFSNMSPRLTNVTRIDSENQNVSNTSKERTKNSSKLDKGTGSSLLRRNNSLPSRPRPKPAPRKRNPSTGDHGENYDPETEKMIDEILKSTPNPSLSLSFSNKLSKNNEKSSKNAASTGTSKSMTREEFEEAINNKNYGGISFREVLNSSHHKNTKSSSSKANKNNPTTTTSVFNMKAGGEAQGTQQDEQQNRLNIQINSEENEDDQFVKLVRNRSHAELQELMEWKNKVDDLNELEQKQLNKLMNTVKNLGLKVPSNESSSVSESKGVKTKITKQNKNIETSGKKKGFKETPLGLLPVISMNEDSDTSHSGNSDSKGGCDKVSVIEPASVPYIAAGEKESILEKSPRFVQRKDTYKNTNVMQAEENDQRMNFADSVSSFGSVSIPSQSFRDDTIGADILVDERTETVTSRLGRVGSANSRPPSSVFSDEDVIQWKRGNILGKGAYGIVWCGLVNSGQLIAVKQIELNIDDRNRAEMEYEKIQEEVDLLKTLKHPNIVGYLGTSLEESTVSIFMEFVPGGSIANLLARFGALEEEVFCNYTKQILEGVQYLHKNNVIHRDIKGGNIMVMHDGIIKLIDFGCAKRLCLNVSTKVTAQSKSRLLKSMRGTPFWMAPEVVKETGHGTKSDIWSIGCTVHEMATKSPPWASMPQMTAIFNIGNDSVPVPELPEKFSSEARSFARSCMTRNPNERPSATELIQHPFILRRKKSRSNSVANMNDFS